MLEFEAKLKLTVPKNQIVLGNGRILIIGKTIQSSWLHQLLSFQDKLIPESA